MTEILAGPAILFLVFALGALLTALMVVLNPNPIRSALFLVLNLFCVAVLYLLLNAYFLAAVQVIVYAGAIMVLFLFVIMLLNLGTPDRSPDRLKSQGIGALLAAIALTSILSSVILRSVPNIPRGYLANRPLPAATTVAAPPARGLIADPVKTMDSDEMGTVTGIGRTLYNPNQPWLFPFEVTSILLLIAVVGSVVLARRATRPGETLGSGTTSGSGLSETAPDGGVL